ncbi:DUF4184 family protein [Streptomyces minutiscleroticus]|uniref:DUF4184 family protein n=1 Tax=Streptomyces minutiscleroticus TaxID=68238 RepID=A0A918KA19_9ACTN|nr:DUF4184 family protein [Streptomyces minutiscleroticus]GGX54403.1 hypothetical protein GCM10010358_05550 [Streptomyces minutiscleroticus]
MPFTLSHAAAVLPAVRTDGSGRGRLVPAVLVAGSCAPDLTYYTAGVVPGGMEFGRFTHSFTGVFTFDVAVAWLLVAGWLLLREPLVALLPRAAQARVGALLRCGAPRTRPGPGLALRWYASAVLGGLTHVVWDAFTHHDGWGTRAFPVLGREVAGAPVFWLLQYGGSAVAAAVIAAFVVAALRRTAPAAPAGVPVLSARDRLRGLAVLGGCAALAAAQRALRWWVERGGAAKPWELVPTLCFGVGAGLVAGTVLYAAAVRLRRPAPVPAAPPVPVPSAPPAPAEPGAVPAAGRRSRAAERPGRT